MYARFIHSLIPVICVQTSGAPATRRLRVGYLSSDLRHHAVGFLMTGVFEAHDHQRFETFAFSIYPQPDESPERRRIRAELHDGVGAELTAVRLKGSIKTSPPISPAKTALAPSFFRPITPP